MRHITQAFPVALTATIVSCGGGSTSVTTASSQEYGSVQEAPANDSSFQNFSPLNRAFSSLKVPTPVLENDGAYLYRFEADADASLEMSGSSPGLVTLSGAGAVVSLPSEDAGSFSLLTWQADLGAGSWELRYDPTSSDDMNPPSAIVDFTGSGYSLYEEVSTRLLVSGNELLVRASIVSDAQSGGTSSEDDFGQPEIPDNATIVVTASTTRIVNTEFITTSFDVPLLDNGNSINGDLLADDGLYSAIVTLTSPGFYFNHITADATLGAVRVQRDGSQRIFGVSGFRARIAGDTAQAVLQPADPPAVTPNEELETETNTHRELIIPLPITFPSSDKPLRLDGFAELWATDRNGEETLIDSNVVAFDTLLEDKGDDTYTLPMRLVDFSIPANSDLYSDFQLRKVSLQSADEHVEILLGTREIQITGLLQ